MVEFLTVTNANLLGHVIYYMAKALAFLINLF